MTSFVNEAKTWVTRQGAMSSFIITNADISTLTKEAYSAVQQGVTSNNGTWSLTQTSTGLSFSVSYKNNHLNQNDVNDQFDPDFDTLSMLSDDSGVGSSLL